MRNLHTGGPNECIDGLQLVPGQFWWTFSSPWIIKGSLGLCYMDYQRKPWILWNIFSENLVQKTLCSALVQVLYWKNVGYLSGINFKRRSAVLWLYAENLKLKKFQ